MEQQSRGADKFNQAINQYFNGERLNILKEENNLKSFVDRCKRVASSFKGEEPVIASEFFFLASYACLDYLESTGVSNNAFTWGKKCIDSANELLKDDEYKIINSIYDIYSLSGPAKDVFRELQKIDKECVTIRIIKNTILSVNYIEDLYNSIFSRCLCIVTDQLIVEDKKLAEEACLLLRNFPSLNSKLRAYAYLSRINEENGNVEEALRNAKTGVDLLGNDIEYDYRNEVHQFWAECWNRVAVCYRVNKDYDFAMSLFEKGASKNIVPCIINLASMYEKGESEDVNLEKSAELLALAGRIEDERKRIEEEIQEKLRKEEEERLAEARRKEQLKKQEQIIAETKKANASKKMALAAIDVVLLILLVWGCRLYFTDSIYDKVGLYQDMGKAVLFVNEEADSPYIIVMDKKNIFLDNNKKVLTLLPVGEKVKTDYLKLSPAGQGIGVSRITADETKVSLCVLSSKSLYIKELIPQKSFLISTKSEKGISHLPGEIEDCYLLTLASSKPFILYVGHGEIDSNGKNLTSLILGDLYETHSGWAKSIFTNNQIKAIQRNNYLKYFVDVKVSLVSGAPSIKGNAIFQALDIQLPTRNAVSGEMLNRLKEEISASLEGRLSDWRISNIFGVGFALENHLSDDGKYTFVIRDDGDDSHDRVGLFMVDNQTKTYKCLNHGMKITFESSRIRVLKYDTFLLFFDSSKSVYYDYQGKRL